MILIVNICAEELHYFEFVKPIEDIVGGDFFTRHYLDLSSEDLKNCDKIIICGTSLGDNNFFDDLDKFDWVRNFDKPLLGICGGMQIIGLIFGGVLKKKTEIGFYREGFKKNFLGLSGEVEVYHLHNNYVSEWSDDWEVFCLGGEKNKSRTSTDEHGRDGNGIIQAVCRGNFYGALFHPEVRNKKMIKRFVDGKH